MATITINGHTYQGTDIQIRGSQLIIDDVIINNPVNEPNLTITIVEGTVNRIDTDRGVICGAVMGNISSGATVECGNVAGSVHSVGSVNCHAVHGNVMAGSSVNCLAVSGNVSSVGYVLQS